MSTIELPLSYAARDLRIRGLSLRRAARIAGWTLAAIAVVVWALLFRPQFLGGPAVYVMVSGISMEPTLHNGDLVIARRQDSYRVGDTVVYRVPKGDTGAGSMIIHRIVGGSAARGWDVRGDNREIPDLWHPKSSDIAGSLWISAPGAGRLLAYTLRPVPLAMISTFLALLIGLPGAAVEAVETRSRRRIWQPQRTATAVAAAAAFVRPFIRTDAVVIVFRKPRLPIPVSFPRAEISALISERLRPALEGLGDFARSWGEAAWTARDLYRGLLQQG